MRKGFTLAEVILVIGIVGIVASLVIPNLQQITNEKELVSSYLKAHSVLNNAYKETEAEKEYKIYGINPDRFKEYLEEHLKTVKCEEHDVCLTDGSYYDYECDENQCNYITVDTNGQKKPNQIGKDIYKFKITPNGLISEGEKDICSGYDCGNYVLSHHKIFDGLLANCEDYGSDGRCIQCGDGYKVENGLCYAVNTPNCKNYTGEECTGCEKTHYLNSKNTCSILPNNCTSANTDGKCTSCSDGYISDVSHQSCALGYYKNDIPVYKVGDYEVANVGASNYSTGTGFTSNYCGSYPSWGCKDYYQGAKNQCEALGMSVPNVSQLSSIYKNWDKKPSGKYWTNNITGSRYGCINSDPNNPCGSGCTTDSVYVHDLNGNIVYENGTAVRKSCGGGVNLVIDFDNGYIDSSAYGDNGGKNVNVLCVK